MNDSMFIQDQIKLALSLWDDDNIASKRIIENLIKTLVIIETLKGELKL